MAFRIGERVLVNVKGVPSVADDRWLAGVIRDIRMRGLQLLVELDDLLDIGEGRLLRVIVVTPQQLRRLD